jgi:signal transduction histidine kinase
MKNAGDTDKSIPHALHHTKPACRTRFDLLSSIAHELRTPMSGTIGLTHALLDSNLSDTQRESVESIYDFSETLLSLFTILMDFFRLEAGALTAMSAPFDLYTCLEQTLETLLHKAELNQVPLTYHIDVQPPGTLVGDASILGRILDYLVTSAIGVAESTNPIAVSISGQADESRRYEEHTNSQDWYAIHILIREYGPPITRRDLDQVFETLPTETKRHPRIYGSEGIALIMSTRLVDIIGGTLHIESSDESGATTWKLVCSMQVASGQ